MSKDKSKSREKKTTAVALRHDLAKIVPPNEFFPKYVLAGVTNWNELQVLGPNNVRYLLSHARSKEQGETQGIAELQEHLALYKAAQQYAATAAKLTVADYFKQQAQQYEAPKFEANDIGRRPGGFDDEDEPLTPESETRQRCTTTFNLCGWCKYVGGGSCRFNYHITAGCNLLDTIDEPIGTETMKVYSSTYVARELKFNTACLLQQLTAEQCERLIGSIQAAIDKRKQERDQIRVVIDILRQQLSLAGTAIKPWLASHRPCSYMEVGDPLVIYTAGWGKDKLVDGDWVKAIGVFGYRHQDGGLSYLTEFPVHSNLSNFEGRGGGGGMARPELLLASEFSLLVAMAQRLDPLMSYKQLMLSSDAADADQSFLRLWFMSIISQSLEGFNASKFFEALKNPQFATPPTGWEPPRTEIEIKSEADAEHALHCLNWKLFESEAEIKKWATMQLQFVHPDKHQQASPAVQDYAKRQTKAVIAARDFLVELFRERHNK